MLYAKDEANSRNSKPIQEVLMQDKIEYILHYEEANFEEQSQCLASLSSVRKRKRKEIDDKFCFEQLARQL